MTQVEITLKYSGYISRQEAEVEKFRSLEDQALPDWLDYDLVPGLRLEARQKLKKIRPGTFGQAGRISGVSPADLSLVMVWSKRVLNRPDANTPPTKACYAIDNFKDDSAHNQCCGDL